MPCRLWKTAPPVLTHRQRCIEAADKFSTLPPTAGRQPLLAKAGYIVPSTRPTRRPGRVARRHHRSLRDRLLHHVLPPSLAALRASAT